jgi:ribosomal protein L37AE/L43A
MYGKGMRPLKGGHICAKCDSKKVKIYEQIKACVTMWQCQECGHKWLLDRRKSYDPKHDDPYESAGITRGIDRDKMERWKRSYKGKPSSD